MGLKGASTVGYKNVFWTYGHVLQLLQEMTVSVFSVSELKYLAVEYKPHINVM